MHEDRIRSIHMRHIYTYTPEIYMIQKHICLGLILSLNGFIGTEILVLQLKVSFTCASIFFQGPWSSFLDAGEVYARVTVSYH